MKISKQVLVEIQACESVSDCFWVIRKNELSNDQLKDIRHFAIECVERVMPIFENEHPADKRPRIAIETARLYLSANATMGKLIGDRRAACAAANSSVFIAGAVACGSAHVLACAATDTDITYAAYAAAEAAHIADPNEIAWQKQRLAEIVLSWSC